MNQLLQIIGFGIITASVLAVAGVGLSLQFSITNFVNFAYGDFATLGAYLALVLNERGMNIWLATALSAVGSAIFSFLMYLWVFKPFLRRGARLVTMLIVTLGVSLAVQNGISAIWGANFQTYTASSRRPLHIGPFLWTPQELVIFAIAIVLLLGLHAMLRYTPLGKAMRAMSDNPELAEVSGIKTAVITNITWLLTGAFIGVAGVVLAINISSFTPLMGTQFLFLIFAVVIVGGIGRIYGAILGALVIGIATEIAGAYVGAAYSDAFAFLIMIVILLVRPQGIFAAKGKA